LRSSSPAESECVSIVAIGVFLYMIINIMDKTEKIRYQMYVQATSKGSASEC
jgi:hypothetical protein